MSPDSREPGQLQQLLSSASAFIAPTTVLTGLLFYFGYAFTRAEYASFGLDVDTIGLNTRDYVMRSPTPLVLPALVLALLGAAVTAANATLHRRIDAELGGRGGASGPPGPSGSADPPGSADPADVQLPPDSPTLRRWRRAARGVLVCAGTALLAGAGLLIGYALGAMREWGPFSLLTACLLALGAALAISGLRTEGRLGRRDPPRASVAMPLYLVLTGAVFWATATVAPFIGRGEARATARHLDRLPAVILDTKERLFLRSPGVVETQLEASAGQSFHYRYRRLRLLIQGDTTMFLVPETWTASNATLAVPLDDSVRVQFQFQNQPP